MENLSPQASDISSSILWWILSFALEKPCYNLLICSVSTIIQAIRFNECHRSLEFYHMWTFHWIHLLWYTKTPLIKWAKNFPRLLVLMSPFSLDGLKSNSVFDCGEFISPTSRILSLKLILKFQWRYLCMKYVFHNVTCNTLNPTSLYFLKIWSPWRLNYNRFANHILMIFPLSLIHVIFLNQSSFLGSQWASPEKQAKHAACQIWDQHCCYNMSYEFKSNLEREQHNWVLFSLKVWCA